MCVGGDKAGWWSMYYAAAEQSPLCVAPDLTPPRAAAQTQLRRLRRLALDLLEDVRRDVADLLIVERALERRHAAAAVGHLRDDLLQRPRVGDVGAAVAARALRSVTSGAVRGEDGLARGGVTVLRPGLPALVLAAVLGAGAPTGRSRGAELA